MFTTQVKHNIDLLCKELRIGESFDVVKRDVFIAGRQSSLFFVDGFIKDDLMERMLRDFMRIDPLELNGMKDLQQFVDHYIPYVEVTIETKLENIVTQVLSGPMAIVIDGYDKVIMLDVRTYPARGPEEPAKEKVLRGSRDGFVETIVFNTALIRRRIRSHDLTFKMKTVGSLSKTDVAIGYIDGLADEKLLKEIEQKIDQIQVKGLSMTDRSIVEAISKKSFLNPYPKVRYTERPDVASAHLLEGKIILIVDNSPSVMILPTTLFSFMQDIDDFYMPVITGNYLRIVRNFILFATLFITPLYLLMTMIGPDLPSWLQAFALKEQPANPLILQFLILEVAIDGLKIASMNTPDTLGMSLSVVGAIILGDIAVKQGWFLPQAVLYMAIVALGSFAQPSIELGYAIKFNRILLLIFTAMFKTWGFVIGLIIIIVTLVANKTVTGGSYLAPLYPFDGKELFKFLIRTPLQNESSTKTTKKD